MNPTFEKWLRILENDRKELLNSLSKISDEQFTKQPKPGKWSLSEIVLHLIAADRLSLDYMIKKSQAIESLDDAGWVEDAKMLFFIASQRLPLKYKAPKGIIQNTPGTIEISAISKDWNLILLNYREFLGRIPEQYVRRKIYKHPMLGRMDAKLCLQSIHEHYQHHLPQIKRLL